MSQHDEWFEMFTSPSELVRLRERLREWGHVDYGSPSFTGTEGSEVADERRTYRELFSFLDSCREVVFRPHV